MTAIRVRSRLTALVLAGLTAAGCGGQPVPSAAALNESYRLAMARTAPLAANFGAGSVRERELLAGLQDYFRRMTPATVAAGTRRIYAADAYLNDNLSALEGVDAIEAYFLAAAGRAELIEVSFQDVARAGPDYYIRWRMAVTAAGVHGGEPMVSYGVSQFRLDGRGQVILHKDFWDAGTGLYEFLPGIGGLLRLVRGRVAH